MMEIRGEEGEQDSEWRDGPGDEIGSDSVLECIRNFPMYSPPRSLTDWRADQVQSPPLDLFGPLFGCEAYLPPATTTVCNIEASLGYEASLFGLQIEYEPYLPPATTNVRSLSLPPRRGQIKANLFQALVATIKSMTIQRFKEIESNAQGYSLEVRCVEVNNVMDEKLNSGVQYNQTFERWPGVEIIQLDSSEELMFGELGAKNIGQEVESAEKSCIAISHSKNKNTIETPKRKYGTKRLITLDDLRQLFGRKRVDAANTLGVSVPTFKRYCRQNGIRWWNGDGCSLVEPKLLNNSVHQNSSGSKPPEVQGGKEISALLGARQDAVTIKAKSEEGILKLQLSSESGLAELQEAVAKRLTSQAFVVEYEDEDQEPILIACDEDWQACVKFFGNQVIRLAIREKISNSKKSHGSGRGLKRKRS